MCGCRIINLNSKYCSMDLIKYERDLTYLTVYTQSCSEFKSSCRWDEWALGGML